MAPQHISLVTYVQSTSLMSRANIPVVATEHPRVLSEYVHRIHLILCTQLMVVIALVIPFTYVDTWQQFALSYPWIGVAPTTMLAVVFMLIPESRMVYPGNWIGLGISTICEAMAIGITAGASNSRVVLVSLSMVLVGCLGCAARHPIRSCIQYHRGGVVSWSPAVLIALSWGLSILSAPVLYQTLGMYDPTLTMEVLLWSEIVSFVFLSYAVAQTYLSTQWFCSPEFVTGSFSMFLGVFSLSLLILWFIGQFVSIVNSLSLDLGDTATNLATELMDESESDRAMSFDSVDLDRDQDP
jgi:hypothetical protein